MVMVDYGLQGEEAVIYEAYFEIICAMAVERRNKGSALFHIIKHFNTNGKAPLFTPVLSGFPR